MNGIQIEKVYNSYRTKHSEMSLRKQYYHSRYTPPELLVARKDGREKTVSKTNFMKYISSMYSGFLTSNKIQYNYLYPAENETALDVYNELYIKENLASKDSEHIINCLVYGASVEVHNFNGNEVIINNFEPLNWVPVQDESDKLVAAIYKAIVEPYTYYKGELLEEELTLYYHYDESMVHIYKAVKNQKTGKIELNLEEEYTHGYGVVPVIFFKTSKEFKSFFDESFLIQNDLYDVLSSAMVDDVKYAIDALLLIKGLDYTKLMAKGKDNVSVIQTLKSVGLFPIPKEADASFLTRNIDTEKFRFALKVCRENIHRMANCPDLVDKLNNEGSVNVTSGIALRLLFQGMEQQGSQFKKYFEEGLRKRIDLVNSIWSKLRFPILQDIQIEFKENIPINEIEIVNSIRQLDGLLAKKDQIALLPFISNPDIALYNLQEEQKNNPQETEKTINIL